MAQCKAKVCQECSTSKARILLMDEHFIKKVMQDKFLLFTDYNITDKCQVSAPAFHILVFLKNN